MVNFYYYIDVIVMYINTKFSTNQSHVNNSFKSGPKHGQKQAFEFGEVPNT